MYTRVTGPNFTHCLRKEVITVGRRSHLPTDICLGDSACISRKHLELHTKNGALFLRCLGKNGIFIDEEFQMLSEDLIPLPNCCRLRFPSTPITLVVEIFDSGSSSRHPKKRTIWRYSAELAGLNELDSQNPDVSEGKRPVLPSLGISGGIKVEDENAATLNSFDRKTSSAYNTLITDSSSAISVPSRCKSGSTEPFSTPEPCSPPESFQPPSAVPQAKVRRLDASLTPPEQPTAPTSVRFPNLVAAYSRTPLKISAQTLNGADGSTLATPLSIERSSSRSPTATASPSLIDEGGSGGGSSLDAIESVEHGSVYEKPPYSYAQLIIQAIVSAPNRRLTLSDIYNYISTQFPYYKPSQKGWQQ